MIENLSDSDRSNSLLNLQVNFIQNFCIIYQEKIRWQTQTINMARCIKSDQLIHGMQWSLSHGDFFVSIIPQCWVQTFQFHQTLHLFWRPCRLPSWSRSEMNKNVVLSQNHIVHQIDILTDLFPLLNFLVHGNGITLRYKQFCKKIRDILCFDFTMQLLFSSKFGFLFHNFLICLDLVLHCLKTIQHISWNTQELRRQGSNLKRVFRCLAIHV